MKIFNIRGNQLYKSLVEEMLASNDYPENFKKKYENSFQKILNDEKNLSSLDGSKELEKKAFKNRLEFGKHIFGVLQNCSFSKVNKNEFVWNYIACYFIKDFISNSQKENRIIYMPKFFDLKRNLARTPWLLYYSLREDSLFALCNPLNIHSNMCEQFVSRQEMLRNTAVGELCMKLYYNPKTKKLRKNAAKHEKDEKIDGWHPGVIYPRLTKAVGKLYKIYDLWTVDTTDLEKLVGKEFSKWSKIE